MNLIDRMTERARRRKMRIAMPEATDERTLRAARRAVDNGVANPLLVGDDREVAEAARAAGVSIDDIAVINHLYHPSRENFYDEYARLRRKENLTPEQIHELFGHPGYVAMMMARFGQCDAVTMGAVFTTADVMRAAIKIGGVAEGVSTVSSSMLMMMDPKFGAEGTMLFADPAVVVDPSAEQLADIAVATADTARDILDIPHRVAMLSFSTKGSAEHPWIEKVVAATDLVRERRPDIMIEGELQVDAALDKAVGESKIGGACEVCGQPTIMIFPTIEAANIGVKLVQRIGGAEAFGPILQGLAIPCSDMSRGATENDVYVNIVITALKAMAGRPPD